MAMGAFQVDVGTVSTLIYTSPKDDMEIEIVLVNGGPVFVGPPGVTVETGCLVMSPMKYILRKTGEPLHGVRPATRPGRVSVLWSWR